MYIFVGWDVETFLSIVEEQRSAIVEALRDDVSKLCAELPRDDPVAQRLREELKRTLEHFAGLMKDSQKKPGWKSCSQVAFAVQFKNTCFFGFRFYKQNVQIILYIYSIFNKCA